MINNNPLLINLLQNQINTKTKDDRAILDEDDIPKIVNTALKQFCFLNEEDFNQYVLDNPFLVNEMTDWCLKQVYVIVEGGEVIFEGNPYNSKPWVDEWKEKWDQFLAFKNTISHLPTKVIDQIDIDSNRILSQLPEPRKYTEFEVIGEVMGLIQMGKTTDYSAVINKSFDVGYDIVTVFTGTSSDLRNQTQERLEQACSGICSQDNKRIGIGKYKNDIKIKMITHQDYYNDKNQLIDGDVGEDTLKFFHYQQGDKYLFVCKRNPAVINKLKRWVKKQKFYNEDDKVAQDIALLIIADESDQAAINTAPLSEKPTPTNGELRAFFNMFKKRAHIGYTATPFANIFINPNPINKKELGSDFFPKDFIYLLEPPNNYLGPFEFFRKNSSYPFIRKVDKIDASSDEYEKIVDTMPLSLQKAINNFLLVGAIRRLRGFGKKHHSMLINIDPYIDPQQKVVVLVEKYLQQLRIDILNKRGSYFWDSIRELWMDDILQTSPKVQKLDREQKNMNTSYLLDFKFEQICSEIEEYLFERENGEFKIHLKEVNSKAKDRLDYSKHKNGLNVIAVGGYSLSRGFTLEGLTISYFLRRSPQADTQLQSCRWFGYPNDYRDLIRVYTSKKVLELLEYATDITYSLVKQLRNMAEKKATPKDFGLFIKNYGSKITPTARPRMRSAQSMRVSRKSGNFAGEELDVSTFFMDDSKNRHNILCLEKLLNKLAEPNTKGKVPVWMNQNPKLVADFIREMKIHSKARLAKIGCQHEIAKYILSEQFEGNLQGIDIVFFNNTSRGKVSYKLGPLSIYAVNRTARSEVGLDYFEVNLGRALTNRHLQYGLYQHEIDIVQERARKRFIDVKTPEIRYVSEVRGERKAGLLMIYVYNLDVINKSLEGVISEKLQVPPIAFYLSLPGDRLQNDVYANWRYTEELQKIVKDMGGIG